MIVIDGTVPGSAKSKLRVDNASVAPLRDRLHQILDLDGRGGHLALVLNPAEGSVPEGCASGKGRVCLRVVHQLNVPHADSILLLPGLPTVSYDPGRVTLPGVLGSFATAKAEFVGIDLTETIPSGAPNQSSDLYMLTRLLPQPNSELRLSLHSDKLEVAGHNGSVGLWLPGTLAAAASSTLSEHYCDGASGMGTLEACGEILQKMDEGLRKAAGVEPNWLDFSCKRVDFTLDFRRIRLWLGLVPETTPGCDPLMHRWDLEWMKNTPSPREYRQGCMKVRGSLHASVDAEPLPVLGQPPDADILFSVGVSKCSSLVQAACATVVDCPGRAREITESQLEALIPSRVSSSLDKQLGPIFSYTAGAGSPYKAPPSSPCAGFGDPNCVAAIRQHHLPASLTRLAYGWFGNAFGSFDTTPSYQYPVTSITGQCPTFFTYVRGKNYDLCVNCPGSECSPDYDKGGCYHVFGWPCETNAYPVTGLDFWYAVDPDADGHREYADNCPMLSNPSQADKDGDGIGDLCDLCPCTVGPDLDGDGVCAVACNGPGDNCPSVANPNQENCNLDAEVARSAETLGDACDPVPCPRFTPVFNKASVVGEHKGPLYTDVKVKQSLDHITIEPIGSRSKTATTLTEVPVEVAQTHYRYCIESQVAGALCFVDTAIHDSWLDKASSAAQEDTFTLWHRVTMNGLGLGVPEGARTYQDGAKFSRTWGFGADFKAWKASAWGAPWIPDLVAAAAPSNTDAFFSFQGRFWVHAATLRAAHAVHQVRLLPGCRHHRAAVHRPRVLLVRRRGDVQAGGRLPVLHPRGGQ
ncbi:MAG: thrombospondin type 3 repeat-containing protein [Polyangiaceae bacterium]|nr:thrombospondin type 3 repeat-containing protein [Polyangiaceae bacterium]